MQSVLALIDAAVSVTPQATSLAQSIPLSSVLITILAILVLAFLVPAILDARHRVSNEAPLVPSYLPFLGSALSFSANPYNFLASCRAKYGEIFTVNLGGKRMTFLCDPRSYPALFKNKSLSFALAANDIATNVLDQSHTSVGHEPSDKAIHQQYTKHLAGAGLEELTKNSYIQIREWLRNDRQRMADSGVKQEQRGIYQLVNEIVFDAGAKAIFGAGLNMDQLFELFTAFDKAFPLLVAKAPSFIVSKAVAARKELIARFGTVEPRAGEANIVAARREHFANNPDIWSLHDVGATQNAILWASVANTIPAATWTLAYLIKHPKQFEIVKQELLENLPYRALSEGDNEVWTRDQCAMCKHSDSAIMEALRMATGSMVLRQASEATTLVLADGRTVGVRMGDSVSIYPSLTHLDGRVFADPLTFKHDRFLNSDQLSLDGAKVTSGFLPFGAGVSLCPGRFWAKNEILIMMALLFQHCELKLDNPNDSVPPFDYSRVGIGVFPPKGDLALKFGYRQE